MDVDQELACRENKTKLLGIDMLTIPVADLIEERPELLPQYKKLKEAQNAYWVDKAEPFETQGTRGIWLHGPPNTGKTRFA